MTFHGMVINNPKQGFPTRRGKVGLPPDRRRSPGRHIPKRDFPARKAPGSTPRPPLPWDPARKVLTELPPLVRRAGGVERALRLVKWFDALARMEEQIEVLKEGVYGGSMLPPGMVMECGTTGLTGNHQSCVNMLGQRSLRPPGPARQYPESRGFYAFNGWIYDQTGRIVSADWVGVGNAIWLYPQSEPASGSPPVIMIEAEARFNSAERPRRFWGQDEPMGAPIMNIGFWPVANPAFMAPPRINPDLSPTESASRTYGPPVTVPQTRVVVREEPELWIGTGHTRKPPGPNTREVKLKIPSLIGVGMFRAVYAGVTEVGDWIDAIFQSFDLKGPGKAELREAIFTHGSLTRAEKVEIIWKHWRHLSPSKLLVNVVNMEIGDRIVAMTGRQRKALYNAVFEKYGSSAALWTQAFFRAIDSANKVTSWK